MPATRLLSIAGLARLLVAGSLLALLVVVAAIAAGGGADASNLEGGFHGGAYGVLQSAGLLFFAFAGFGASGRTRMNTGPCPALYHLSSPSGRRADEEFACWFTLFTRATTGCCATRGHW